jgi:hypothetical protein
VRSNTQQLSEFLGPAAGHLDFAHLLYRDGDSAFDVLDAFDPFQIDDVFSVAAEECLFIQLGVELI